MKQVSTFLGFSLLLVLTTAAAQKTDPLPGTRPLTIDGDLSAQMVEGIDRFLLREIDHSLEKRSTWWQRDFSSREEKSRCHHVDRFSSEWSISRRRNRSIPSTICAERSPSIVNGRVPGRGSVFCAAAVVRTRRRLNPRKVLTCFMSLRRRHHPVGARGCRVKVSRLR